MFLYLILFVVGFLYIYYKNKHSYYKKNCNLEGPKPFLFFGNNLNIFFDTFANYEKKNFKKYGRTYADFLFHENGCITTSNPEHIKKILIKDFPIFTYRFPVVEHIKYVSKGVIFQNKDWKRVRTQITPVFTSGRLKVMIKKFKHPVDNVINQLEKYLSLKQSNKIEMKKLCKSFSLDIIANVVFSLETNSHNDDVFSQKVRNLLKFNKFIILLGFILPRFLMKNLGLSNNSKESSEYFVKLATSIIEERKKKNSIVYNDFIELLLKSEAEEVLSNSDENGHINRKLTLEEIIGQCFVFFIGGMETVSTVLAFFFYELAIHEKIQEKLFEEIKKSNPDEELNYENLNNSKYLDCVLYEVLRRHVTLNRIFRRAASNYDFGEFKVKKDQVVGISIYNLHHDPDIYEDPYEFKPERFENLDSIPSHLFIPFSDGPRNCIGNRLALFEMKYLIISILKKFKVLKTEYTQVPFYEDNYVNLVTFKEMYLGFEKRD